MRNEVEALLVGLSQATLCLEADWRSNRPPLAKHHRSHLSSPRSEQVYPTVVRQLGNQS